MKAYRIREWNKHYEVSQMRKCKNTHWVAITNSHDKIGYAILVGHERFTDIFTAWILMVQVASKMPVRGELVGDKPLSAKSLAIRTRTKPEIFELALKVLADPEIGWLEVFEWERDGS